MPKGKGKQFVDDEIDAWDYAEEDAAYERWEETQVKENKPIEKTPKPKAAPKQQEKPQEKSKEEPTQTEEVPPPQKEEEEPVLEQFDDWEAAMDALDAKISHEEAKKASERAAVQAQNLTNAGRT
jgi:outer membrane biosynthesis protein TonB